MAVWETIRTKERENVSSSISGAVVVSEEVGLHPELSVVCSHRVLYLNGNLNGVLEMLRGRAGPAESLSDVTKTCINQYC